MHSDWPTKVTGLVLTHQTALFQSSVATLLKILFVTLTPGIMKSDWLKLVMFEQPITGLYFCLA